MTVLKTLFWACIILVCYTYVGYGILLWLFVHIKRIVRGRTVQPVLPTDEALPHVTLLICAYNEQDIVDEKMKNTGALDYPQDKLHIMWVTDGSTDHTNDYLKRFQNVQIVYTAERKGKTAALNHGISQITSPITVMTDANTMLNKEAVREIVRCFMNPQVACVAGEKRVKARHEDQVAAKGEGLYWKYESQLKKLDSELYSAMGAAGELNAIRTHLYQPMPENALLDDFVMSMRMVDQGYRIAYTSEAYALEYGSANIEEEAKRKQRIAAGGLQSCWWLRNMMNPFHQISAYPQRQFTSNIFHQFTVAFQFVSHRVLRWTITPVALLALIPLNVALVMMKAGSVYSIFWILQICFYLAAYWGWKSEQNGRKNKFFYVCYYFLFMNMNVFRGMRYLANHKSSGTWEKAKRA